MCMYCDNEAASFMASNETFYMRMKHIEIYCHFIRHYFLNKMICTPHASSENQLANIFTKSLTVTSYDVIGHKLGMFDLCVVA